MPKNVLITGGAGFIGSNAALYFSKIGYSVVILDNLSRPGALYNALVLADTPMVRLEIADISDRRAVSSVLERHGPFDAVIHLAAQVAVTTSLHDPEHDFSVNVTGTFNILECQRRLCPDATLIFSSTNKVYGSLEHIPVRDGQSRYAYADNELAACGVSEDTPLSFETPYGCSKGAADQYVLDYARSFDLNATSFRQSCVYGPYQYGLEDQGWIAWFVIAALLDKEITIYGDGRQVRDVLFVRDLVRAFDAAIHNPHAVKGRAYNIGGGPCLSFSLLEVIEEIQRKMGLSVRLRFAPWRPRDQKVYVSNTNRLFQDLGWRPQVSLQEGLDEMIKWAEHHTDKFRAIHYK